MYWHVDKGVFSSPLAHIFRHLITGTFLCCVISSSFYSSTNNYHHAKWWKKYVWWSNMYMWHIIVLWLLVKNKSYGQWKLILDAFHTIPIIQLLELALIIHCFYSSDFFEFTGCHLHLIIMAFAANNKLISQSIYVSKLSLTKSITQSEDQS